MIYITVLSVPKKTDILSFEILAKICQLGKKKNLCEGNQKTCVQIFPLRHVFDLAHIALHQ